MAVGLFDPVLFDPVLFDTIGIDSSDIDQAIVDLLLADAQLRALLPDGVFFDEAGKSMAVAGQDSKRFVLVSLIDAHDGVIFEGRSDEDKLYLIEARGLSSLVTAAAMKAAAARIDAVLQLGSLVIPGYTLQVMRRTEPTRSTDVDAVDTSIRWYHRGGRYQVKAAPDGT